MASLPSQIAKYHIIRRLGHGGMGAVYLGRDPDLDRSVAIKVLREPMADDELLQRFLREARSAASLRHENLITIYEVGSYDQQPFIAMEYVDGATLGELIKKRQPLPLAQKLAYLEQICAGLHHAHRVGIVHRDIKPANLMVDAHGVIRILDFGIARVANSGMTSDGALIGTLNYMSPEQMLGRPVDFRSDMFSLGAVAYELLSYHQAFPGSLDDGLLQRLPQMPPTPLDTTCPGLPPGLEAIVMRALAKTPTERFADLEEMRGAVRHLRAGLDPRLEVETIVIPGRDKAKPATRPASSADRRDLLERRARQIAVHRDAARAALARGDLDGAVAACDDALTIDPDDLETSRLLAEVQQAQEQHNQESKARRDRQRTMRQRIADAELTLSRGDVESAARLLDEVLREEAQEPSALALLDKVRDAAGAAGVTLPPTLNLAATRAATVAEAEATRLVRRPEPPASKTPWIAAAAAIVLVIGGGAAWWMTRSETIPVEETSTTASASTPTPPPTAPAVSAPVETTPPAPTPSTAPVPTPTPATQAPSPAVTPVPAATPPPPTADAIAPALARVTQLQQSGNVEGALTELSRIGVTNDTRVSTLARAVMNAAFRSMETAMTAAASQKAASLAAGSYDAAEQARGLADAASSRGDFVNAGTRALAATTLYRKAEADARTAAAIAAKVPEPIAKPVAPPANTSAAAPVAAAPEPPPRSEAAAPTAPPAAARPSALDTERPGILRALNRYQDAYREMNVTALRAVYPSLPRETGQQIERQFRDCRTYDVTFGNMQVGLAADDSTSATVTVRTTYMCQPKTRQAAQPVSVQDIFLLRKVGGEWLIDSTGSMDSNRRR